MTTREQYWSDPEKYRALGREYYARNREAQIEYAREYRKTHGKGVDRRHHLKSRYGMTEEDYEALVRKQGNQCAICKGARSGPGKNWHIDHDHRTGRTRGLLCSRCNTAIGLLREDPDLARTLAAYLEAFSNDG